MFVLTSADKSLLKSSMIRSRKRICIAVITGISATLVVWNLSSLMARKASLTTEIEINDAVSDVSLSTVVPDKTSSTERLNKAVGVSPSSKVLDKDSDISLSTEYPNKNSDLSATDDMDKVSTKMLEQDSTVSPTGVIDKVSDDVTPGNEIPTKVPDVVPPIKVVSKGSEEAALLKDKFSKASTSNNILEKATNVAPSFKVFDKASKVATSNDVLDKVLDDFPSIRVLDKASKAAPSSSGVEKNSKETPSSNVLNKASKVAPSNDVLDKVPKVVPAIRVLDKVAPSRYVLDKASDAASSSNIVNKGPSSNVVDKVSNVPASSNSVDKVLNEALSSNAMIKVSKEGTPSINVVDKVSKVASSNTVMDNDPNVALSNNVLNKVSEPAPSSNVVDKVSKAAPSSNVVDKVSNMAPSRNVVDKLFKAAPSSNVVDKLFKVAPSSNVVDKVSKVAPSGNVVDKLFKVGPSINVDDKVSKVGPSINVDDKVSKAAPSSNVVDKLFKVAPSINVDDKVSKAAPSSNVVDKLFKVGPSINVVDKVSKVAPSINVDDKVSKVAPSINVDDKVSKVGPSINVVDKVSKVAPSINVVDKLFKVAPSSNVVDKLFKVAPSNNVVDKVSKVAPSINVVDKLFKVAPSSNVVDKVSKVAPSINVVDKLFKVAPSINVDDKVSKVGPSINVDDKVSEVAPSSNVVDKLFKVAPSINVDDKVSKVAPSSNVVDKITKVAPSSNVLDKVSNVALTGAILDKASDVASPNNILNIDTDLAPSSKILDKVPNISPPTSLEWTPYMDVLKDDVLQEPALQNIKTIASAEKSLIRIIDKKSMYRVGDEIRINIQLYDGLGGRREVGGDKIIVRIFEDSLQAGASGYVLDHDNGTYTAVAKCLWSGQPSIRVYIDLPREDIRMLYKYINKETHATVRTITYNNNEEQPCHPFKHWFKTETDICDMTERNGGMSWYCQAPKLDNMSCDDVFRLAKRLRMADLATTEAEKLLLEQPLNSFPLLRVDVKEMRTDSNDKSVKPPCSSYSRSKLWFLPSPVGHFYQDKWTPEHCSVPSSDKFIECLRNKHIILCGDMTLRKWQKVLSERFMCHDTADKSYKYLKTVAISHYCPNINLTIDWIGHPLSDGIYQNSRNTPSTNMLTYPRQKNMVFVIHLFVFLARYHHSLFRYRMRQTRKSIEAFLKINEDATFFLKGANPQHSRNIFRYFNYVFRLILIDEFRGLYGKVVYLDQQDVTIAVDHTIVNHEKVLAEAMVYQMLAYMCT